MRRLYSVIGPRFVHQLAELHELCSGAEWTRRLAEFRLDEMIDECDGLAYAAATI